MKKCGEAIGDGQDRREALKGIRHEQRELQRQDVEHRLLTAFESPRNEMTKADWLELRESIIKRRDGSEGTRQI